MNLRGHFTSDVADLETTTMRDYANDIGVAMRQLGRPAVILGWGIGALAALLYAERIPGARPRPAGSVTPGRGTAAPARASTSCAPSPPCTTPTWWGWTGTLDELRERMPDMDETT